MPSHRRHDREQLTHVPGDVVVRQQAGSDVSRDGRENPDAQLRLVVDSARITLADGFTFQDGSTTKSLKVPSGGHSGIKVSFPGKLDLTEDVDVVVDFDVAQNFVFQGPPARPHDVLFTPHLKGSVQPLQP